MVFEALPENRWKIIQDVVTTGIPIYKADWLKFFKIGSEVIFGNARLSPQVITTGVWTSGAFLAPYCYEIARTGTQGVVDIDRYPLSFLGSTLLKGQVVKNFPEHHSSGLPVYYQSGLSVMGIGSPWAFTQVVWPKEIYEQR